VIQEAFWHGSRTIPFGFRKAQVNNSVDLGGHNTNRFLIVDGPGLTIQKRATVRG